MNDAVPHKQPELRQRPSMGHSHGTVLTGLLLTVWPRRPQTMPAAGPAAASLVEGVPALHLGMVQVQAECFAARHTAARQERLMRRGQGEIAPALGRLRSHFLELLEGLAGLGRIEAARPQNGIAAVLPRQPGPKLLVISGE